jgi:DNA-directed RNA polymerase subunit RPC12/RpoP
MTIKVEEYKCKYCGYSLLLTEDEAKDDHLYCPSCNTKFVGTIVTFLAPKKKEGFKTTKYKSPSVSDKEYKTDREYEEACIKNYEEFGNI